MRNIHRHALRLFQVINALFEIVEITFGSVVVHGDFGVRHVQVFGDVAIDRRFVHGRIGEVDRKSLQRIGIGTRQQPRHRRRVDAARQIRADRHFADGVRGGRVLQCIGEFLRPEFFVVRLVLALARKFQIPILFETRHPAPTDHQLMPGRQFAYAFERGVGCNRELIREVITNRIKVELRLHQAAGENCLALRTRHQRVAVEVIKQRLDPQPVTRQDDRVGAQVMRNVGKHAAQPLRRIHAFALHQMQHHFGVGMRGEHHTLLLQLRAQFAIIVNLAVEHDRPAFVRREHRLRTARNVDNRQARMPKTGGAAAQHILRIGPAMLQRAIHARKDSGVGC